MPEDGGRGHVCPYDSLSRWFSSQRAMIDEISHSAAAAAVMCVSFNGRRRERVDGPAQTERCLCVEATGTLSHEDRRRLPSDLPVSAERAEASSAVRLSSNPEC